MATAAAPGPVAPTAKDATAPALDKPVLPPVKKAPVELTPLEQRRRVSAFKAFTRASKRGALNDLRRAFTTITGGATLSQSTDQPVLALVDEALEIACVHDRVEIVQWLVAFGADPRQALGHDAIPGVLHAAAAASLGVLKYLKNELECDLGVTVLRNGSTALHLAAEAKHHGQQPYVATCEWLIKNGVDVNTTRPKDKMTALHIAARSGKDKIVRTLLDNKADPTLCCVDIGKASDSITPLMLASRGMTKMGVSGHDRAIKHLNKALAAPAAAGQEASPPKKSLLRRSRRSKHGSRGASVTAMTPPAAVTAIEAASAPADQTAPDDDTASLHSRRHPQSAGSREVTAIELARRDAEVTSLNEALREEQAAQDALRAAQLRAAEAKRLARKVRRSMKDKSRSESDKEEKAPTSPRRRSNSVSAASPTELEAATVPAETRAAVAVPAGLRPKEAKDGQWPSQDAFCTATPSQGDGPRTQSAPGRVAGGVRTETTSLAGGGAAPPTAAAVAAAAAAAVAEAPAIRTRRLSRSNSGTAMETTPERARRQRALSLGGESRRVSSAGPAGRPRRESLSSPTTTAADGGDHGSLQQAESLRSIRSATSGDTDASDPLSTSWNGSLGADPAMMDKCATCGKDCDIQLCVQCLSVGYCSRACQKVDWKRHKLVCRPKSAQKAADAVGTVSQA